MKKLVKIFIYVFGLLCAYGFFAIRFPMLFNAIVEDKIVSGHWEFVRWGELYYFNFIEDFKVDGFPDAKEKYRLSAKNPGLEEADILLFGDSFFDYARFKNIPERLSDHLGAKVRFDHEDHPVQFLYNNGYKKQDVKKYLVYETVERNINMRFGDPYWRHEVPRKKHTPQETSVKAEVLNFLFPKERENLYAQLIGRSYITRGINEQIATLRYRWFGYRSALTPVVAADNPDDPFLFYYKEVSDDTPFGFYYTHTDSMINSYCDNFLLLKENLEKEYNLELVVLITPNKYTLYHTKINNDKYNNLIPLVQEGLRKRGVKYVDVYSPLKKGAENGEIYYHGTDTHWNEKGIDVGFKELLNVVRTKYPHLDSLSVNP